MRFLIRLLISAAALWVATEIVPGVTYKGELAYLLLVALLFGQRGLKVRDHEHDMSHAFRAGPKAGDVAARRERRVGQHRPVKRFEPVSGGIAKRDEVANKPLISE